MQRTRALTKMQSQVFDIAVVGGGITGAGAARDAASRGLSVALIEGQDFASGTSSRSSKLIHGGIRYLENMEFGLVFEALSERARLFEIAPHLVHPLEFLIPIYKSGRVPVWKMGLGMIAYDALSLYEAPELHRFLDSKEIAHEFPAIQTADLTGGFVYSDAYMDDDRLVHETLRSAVQMGAVCANYVRAVGVHRADETVHSLECEDVENHQRFDLKARHFVSCVGPWTDRFGELVFNKWPKKMRPSKGVHLTFHRSRFPLKSAVVMGAERRIVFAIPRHEMVIVGTTDTDYPGDPSQVRTEFEDVKYLLDVIDKYFPGFAIGPADILGCYAGVRPLIHDGAETESKTSREHEIWTTHKNVTFVAGGKYTTYRLMAQQTVDEALAHFPIEDRVRYGTSRTLDPLNPLVSDILLERARREHEQWAPDLPRNLTARLADRHGLEGAAILAEAQRTLTWPPAASAAAPALAAEQFLWQAEALHAIEHTMCHHLTDFYFRRTPLILSRKDHGLPFAKAIAVVMAAKLGWTSARIDEEINALQNRISWDLAAVT